MATDFQDGSIPDLPNDYDSSSTTQEQDIKQMLVYQKAELSLLDYQINHNQLHDKEVSDSLKAINDSLNNLIQQGSQGSSSLQDSNTQTIASLHTIENSLDIQHDTNAMIDSWGSIYVPLILVVTMLWWFFRQFIRSYK